MAIDREEMVRLTEQYGGAWGLNHTRRLLHLVEQIGAGQAYDEETVWLAAHLHDWGAYAPWAVKGVEHVDRSVQVAAEFLAEHGCPVPLAERVLECIRLHHAPGGERCRESLLLFEADVLDFLGVVGVLRDFAKNPRDMRGGYEACKKRREKLPGQLTLPRSQEMAAERVRQMDELLTHFEQDSWGCF